MSAESNERYTPDDVVAQGARHAGVQAFDLDAAACAVSHHAPRYFTVADDGLIQRWFGHVWLNPPFDDLGSWTAKAVAEVAAGHALSVTMLLPAHRTEQPWWQENVEPRRDVAHEGVRARVHFIAGRTRFLNPSGQRMGSPRFGCCFVVFTRQRADKERTARRPGAKLAVTPELMVEGQRLLSSGLGIRAMCERIGVHQRSWYRAVRPERERRPRRNPMALTRATIRRVRRLRRAGRTLKEIAELTGLHMNTVHKYCGAAARRGVRSRGTTPGIGSSPAP